MCFYNIKYFSCGDWAWGAFAAKCNYAGRVGETCGMKLVHQTEDVQTQCKLCEKIETKYRRRKGEQERIARWRREGGVMKASMEKSQALINDLEQEIRSLEHERMLKQMAIGKSDVGVNVRGIAGTARNKEAASSFCATADEAKILSYDSETLSDIGAQDDIRSHPDQLSDIHEGARPSGVFLNEIDAEQNDRESLCSPAASVFSIASCASTNTQYSKYSSAEVGSATSELAQLLSNDEFLRPLYQEAINSESIGGERFARNFRRLLKIYSEGLRDISGESLELLAARLVDVRARHIAESIKQRYLSEQGRRREVKEAVDNSDEEEAAIFQEETFLTIAPVQDFLTQTEPYAKLKKDFMSFVKPSVQLPTEGDLKTAAGERTESLSLLSRLMAGTEQSHSWAVRQWLGSMGVLEKPLEPEKQRIRWKCRCGANLFDDYHDSETTALEEIQTLLDHASDAGDTPSKAEQGCDSPSTRNSTFSQFTTPIISYFTSRHKKPPRGSHLPMHNSQRLGSSAVDNGDSVKSDPMHLLMCMQSSGMAINLYQGLVNSLKSDRELFVFLEEAYFRRRGKLRSVLSLRKPVGVKFVEFSLLPSRHLDVHEHERGCKEGCRCLPPKKMVDDAEYKYHPVPPRRKPPIGPNAMAHYLTHSSHVKEGSTWILNQLPKKLKGELEERLDSEVTGWGIYFQEGLNWSKIWTALLVIYVCGSAVFGILWSIFKQDLQGAFGVASWWISLCSFCLGYMATRE